MIPPFKWKLWIFRIKPESSAETQSLRHYVSFSKIWPKAASFLVNSNIALSQRVYTTTLGSAHKLLDSSLGLSLLSTFAFWMFFKKTPHTKKGSSLCTDDIWRKPLQPSVECSLIKPSVRCLVPYPTFEYQFLWRLQKERKKKNLHWTDHWMDHMGIS